MDENEKKDTEGSGGCLPPILFWGTILAVGFIAKQVNEASPGSGITLIKWVLAVVAVGVAVKFIQAIIGNSAEEKKSNLKYIFGALFKILAAIVVLGLFGSLFHSCGGGFDLNGVRSL